MNSNEGITNILTMVLMFMVIILIVLLMIYVVIKLKSNAKKNVKNKKSTTLKSDASVIATEYDKQPIFKFMEFEQVQDNMIVQKNGRRFLMAIECQGVNYDLMSQMEKVSVEESFMGFLNSLRFPIQLYVQTRTINLESSLDAYNDRVQEMGDKLEQMRAQYEAMVEANIYSKEQLERAYYEIVKQNNLYEYGKDVIYNTELLSKNKNILTKKYYIIISHYTEESEAKYDQEEIKNMAFSELYTRAQSIVSSLSATGVKGRVLNSTELVDLLYISYNRDESEVFDINKALRFGCDEIYTTSEDVLNKKMRVIDEKIQAEAMQRAREAVEEAKTEQELEIQKKEDEMDGLIAAMTQIILEQNRKYLGNDITNKAKEKDKAKQSKDKEDEENVHEQAKKTTRTRKRKQAN